MLLMLTEIERSLADSCSSQFVHWSFNPSKEIVFSITKLDSQLLSLGALTISPPPSTLTTLPDASGSPTCTPLAATVAAASHAAATVATPAAATVATHTAATVATHAAATVATPAAATVATHTAATVATHATAAVATHATATQQVRMNATQQLSQPPPVHLYHRESSPTHLSAAGSASTPLPSSYHPEASPFYVPVRPTGLLSFQSTTRPSLQHALQRNGLPPPPRPPPPPPQPPQPPSSSPSTEEAGERLYMQVSAFVIPQNCGKVTGMLLERYGASGVLQLLSDPDELHLRIAEANSVLEAAGYQVSFNLLE
eukprot:TRINITY_DN1883_c0_g1_i1.p1 TRINITY_DN1883_c0_g1~~TRINITY_DN1883_c0_g1_i1.p1  ORF type:complete len:357 (-),score=72.17 TRINITY_DN1883_c0_g1_i1:139-1080(-)